MLELGDDCASQDHKNHVNECPLTSPHKNLLVSKNSLIPVHIANYIVNVLFCGESC